MKKPKTNLNTYVIYLRKSREEEEGTLEHHKTLCLDFAAKHQFPVSKIYEEIVSGKETEANRPKLAEFLSDAKDRKFCGVIIFDTDRLSRDKFLQPNILNNLKNLDIKVYSIKTQGEVRLESATDELTLNIMALMSEFEYNQIKFRYAQGKQASCMSGGYLASRAVYGYKKKQVVENGKVRKTLEIYEPEAEVVRRVFAYKLQGWSLWKIAEQLSLEGIKTQYNKDWTTTTLMNMLRNEEYYGCVSWGKRKNITIQEGCERKTKQVKSDDYLLIENAHPAIIDKDTWLRVQPLISSTPNTTKPLTNIFCGLLKCHDCGYAISANRVKRKCKNGEIHHYIRLVHRSYVYECKHRTFSMSQNIVVDEVIKQIKSQIEDLEAVASIDKNNPFEAEKQRLQNLINQRRLEKDKLWGEFMNGIASIPNELKEEFRNNLMSSITEKNNNIEELQKELEAIPTYTEIPKEKVLTLYKALDYLKNYKTYPGDLLDINIFLKSFIKRIEIYPDTKQIEVVWIDAPDKPDEWKYHTSSVVRNTLKTGHINKTDKKDKNKKGTGL